MTRNVEAPTTTSWHVQDGRAYRSQPTGSTSAFHQRLPGYAPSKLVRAGSVAKELGLGQVWVKDESNRLGLPAFKILGASWASYRALTKLGGWADDEWRTLEDLARLVAERTSVKKLAAATDGNHGRAVARFANLLGLQAAIFVPLGTVQARIEAIENEGATVEVVNGGYGDAVRRSAEEASDECLVISDTSWPGYQDVPADVIEGYSTIFEEAEAQLAEAGGKAPDVVLIQVGVGALAGAAARHYRSKDSAVRLVCVEPLASACNLASIQEGEIVSIPGPHSSIMVGLNCDTPSMIAWPDVSQGFDSFIAVEDDAARQAMRLYARDGVVAGETGAAGLAGLIELTTGVAKSAGEALGLDENSSVLLISTEGATDPEAYAQIVDGAHKEEANA
ncbi:MAG TPA: diaminopropionate ammonia-lyase [Actinomycetales bacterium]|nr:diaminopropionate ammonia-lyase [Actinomycetales bacterium]